MKFVLYLFWLGLAAGSALAQQPAAMVPYSPSVIEDKKGNEWFIEQNGGLQRNGSLPSMIGNAMMLQLGNQQFYSQQPLISPDGRDLVMTSPQPMNGLLVTRRITVMEREGALRYVEEFANTTGRDLAFAVEFRHSFNNQSKGLLSDTGRPLKDALQNGESGVVALAGPEEKAPSVLLTLCAPGAQTLPRISARNGYQFSIYYNLTIPAGQSVTLVHAISQAKVGPTTKQEDIAKAFQPIAMQRLTKGLPKNLLKTAANLWTQGRGHGLEDWFPAKYWGISPESSDVLVLDDTSRLKGRAAMTPASMTSAFGKVAVTWENIAAFAGTGFTQTEQSWLWLRDGQRWKGTLDTRGLKFTLTAGAELDLPRPNRLILRRPIEEVPGKPPEQALLETWSGERIAFEAVGNLNADTPWGRLTVPWADVLALSPADSDSLGGMLDLLDGSRVRVLPAPDRVSLKTKSFGTREIDFSQVRRAITPLAAKAPAEEGEPATSFVDLAGDQRLVGRVTSGSLRFLTRSGPVDLAPATIREMHEFTDDEPATPTAPRRFQAELWGSGTIVGSVENPEIKIEGRGFAWTLPVQHLTRIVNPVPVADTALMRRTGDLIQALGDAQWKTRETATTELRELGSLAKTSLQEALKQATDAEVTRRLETLLSELD